MSTNADTAIAWTFHNATRYLLSPESPGGREILMGDPTTHGPALGEQSLAIEPAAFKFYTSLDPIPLPGESGRSSLPALEAIASTGMIESNESPLDLKTIARLCLRSNGILKRWKNPAGKELYFRAAGCTGARYHLELYLVTGPCEELEPGVYHYDARNHALRRLRSGDFRGNVVSACCEEPAIAAAPLIMICASTFWRNAWRYQERAYRHVFWDTGTLVSSLFAVAADAEVPAKVVLGYDDRQINALIDVDGEREAAVALVALGRTGTTSPEARTVTALNLPTAPISAREIDFPMIREMHTGSSIQSNEVEAWRGRRVEQIRPAPSGKLIHLHPLPMEDLPSDSIESVIQRRRSNRHYDAATPLSFEFFSTVLLQASHGTSIDAVAPESAPLHDVYLIVNNVEGLPAGSYCFHRNLNAIELLAAGDQRAAARELACGQEYAGEAHVNVYALTDLHALLAAYGNRGYRLAQLEAALFGGRLQLAAHALGLGAVGSTSADDAVIAHFSPHAAGRSFMFIAVFGIRRRATEQERAKSTGFIKSKDGE